MTAFLELIQMSVISVLTVPLNPFFWLVVYFVYMQYKRSYDMEILALGEPRKSLMQMMGNSLFMGMLGGLVGTILVMLLGITIESKDFLYVFPLAIFLMLINIRYICFSYAGGLLALSSLVLGVPKLNVSSIIAIVAILHLVESILIWVDGHRDAIPIFINRGSETVGAFSLQKFWPIPFAILMAAIGPLEGAREINLPDWWPLFKGNVNFEDMSLQILAVVAALGYGDMAVTGTPKEKSRKSSLRLFIYSLILLVLSVLSTSYAPFKYVAALFAPLGHEILVLYGQREEKNGKPLFNQGIRGVRVLDIKSNSIGWRMKIEQGDILLNINNRAVNCRDDIQEILNGFPTYIWMEVQNIRGNIRTLEYKDYRHGISNLGIILVSKDSDVVFDTKNSVSILKNFLIKTLEKYLRHRYKNK